MAKTIFIRRTAALGDVVLCAPIILHYITLGHKVVLISRFAKLFKPSKNLVLRDKHDFFSRLFLKLHRILISNATYINLDNSYEQWPELSIVDGYKQRCHIISDATSNPGSLINRDEWSGQLKEKTIIFHIQAPSLKYPYRSIHNVDWKLIETRLTQAGYICIELLDINNSSILEKSISVKYEELPGLISQTSALVGLDSGPAHIANLLGIRSFVFFGSVDPDKRILIRKTTHVFQNDCEHAGCYHSVKGCTGVPCKYLDALTPPCCTFETEHILKSIDVFIQNNLL